MLARGDDALYAVVVVTSSAPPPKRASYAVGSRWRCRLGFARIVCPVLSRYPSRKAATTTTSNPTTQALERGWFSRTERPLSCACTLYALSFPVLSTARKTMTPHRGGSTMVSACIYTHVNYIYMVYVCMLSPSSQTITHAKPTQKNIGTENIGIVSKPRGSGHSADTASVSNVILSYSPRHASKGAEISCTRVIWVVAPSFIRTQTAYMYTTYI